MCLAAIVCVFMHARPYVCKRVCVHVKQQLRAGVGMAEVAAVAAAVGVLCVFWPCVLSVCCVSAVSQGNAWLPIQAGADPAVPS